MREVLKHGTLSRGFVGLAETLKALVGEHHGESEHAQNLGLEIIGHMRSFLDAKAKETGMNFTLLATPAEALSGRFLRMDVERFGVIEGITDREYYTNSFHIPVYYQINHSEDRAGGSLSCADQCRAHQLCRAGRDPSDNLSI